jgi:hypothetical protein
VCKGAGAAIGDRAIAGQPQLGWFSSDPRGCDEAQSGSSRGEVERDALEDSDGRLDRVRCGCDRARCEGGDEAADRRAPDAALVTVLGSEFGHVPDDKNA